MKRLFEVSNMSYTGPDFIEATDEVCFMYSQRIPDKDPNYPVKDNCAPLIHELSTGYLLPALTHVCYQTFVRSCDDWRRSTCLISEERIYLGNGKYADLTEFEEDDEFWPIPVVYGPEPPQDYIVLAIRQWVEEDPTNKNIGSKLARNLAQLPEWNDAVEEIREINDFWPPLLERAKGLLRTTARDLLRTRNLPDTPSTAKYLISQVSSGDYEGIWPTRGVLVTSLALADYNEDDYRQYKMNTRRNMISQLSVLSPWMTAGLLRSAQETMMDHTNWWKGFPGEQLWTSNLRTFNRRTEDPTDNLVEDYLKGSYSYDELLELVYRLRVDDKGMALTPSEKKAARYSLDKRIRRKKYSR